MGNILASFEITLLKITNIMQRILFAKMYTGRLEG